MYIIYFILSLTGHRITWEEEIRPPTHTLRKCLHTIGLYTHLWRSISWWLSDVEGPAHCRWCHPVGASPGVYKPASWASHGANYYFSTVSASVPVPSSYIEFLLWLPLHEREPLSTVSWNKPFPPQITFGCGVFYRRLESSLGGCFSRTYQDVFPIGSIFWRNVQEFHLFGILVNTAIVCSFCHCTDWGT